MGAEQKDGGQDAQELLRPRRYSAKEFAALITKSLSTLKRWDRRGLLKANRYPSGHTYYTDEHIRVAIGIASPPPLPGGTQE